MCSPSKIQKGGGSGEGEARERGERISRGRYYEYGGRGGGGVGIAFEGRASGGVGRGGAGERGGARLLFSKYPPAPIACLEEGGQLDLEHGAEVREKDAEDGGGAAKEKGGAPSRVEERLKGG